MSRTLATLAEVRDRVLWCLNRVDLNLVEGVLDDGDGHECLADEYSIGQIEASTDSIGTLSQVSSSELLNHSSSSSDYHDVQGTSNKMTLQRS